MLQWSEFLNAAFDIFHTPLNFVFFISDQNLNLRCAIISLQIDYYVESEIAFPMAALCLILVLD